MISEVKGNFQIQGQHNYYASSDVMPELQNSVFQTVENLKRFSPIANKAVSKLENVIMIKNSDSYIPSEFSKTEDKLHEYAEDAYGFVSRQDKAILINEENHQRKDKRLEGTLSEQASDTVTHEAGHLIDDELSITDVFKTAYLNDLKNIHSMLQNGESEIMGEDLADMLVYLKHYMEGVDFSDGIDESDITREGLRENFAECFSTIADTNPSKINLIYASLFKNTMKETMNFVI